MNTVIKISLNWPVLIKNFLTFISQLKAQWKSTFPVICSPKFLGFLYFYLHAVISCLSSSLSSYTLKNSQKQQWIPLIFCFQFFFPWSYRLCRHLICLSNYHSDSCFLTKCFETAQHRSPFFQHLMSVALLSADQLLSQWHVFKIFCHKKSCIN